MTEKPSGKKTNPTPAIAASDLQALFGDTPDSSEFDHDGIDANRLHTLISWVCRAGGLITIGSADDGSALYFSVRYGEAKRAYKVESPELFDMTIERLIEGAKLVVNRRRMQNK